MVFFTVVPIVLYNTTDMECIHCVPIELIPFCYGNKSVNSKNSSIQFYRLREGYIINVSENFVCPTLNVHNFGHC